MEPTLHLVMPHDLPNLKDWLEKHLPDSRKIYFTVLETIRGNWTGTKFYTLGWPDILAVGEGLVGLDDSPCALYHREPRTTSVYAPHPGDLETLLLFPGFLDWSLPIIFQAVTKKLRPTIQEVSSGKGGNLTIYANVLVEATQQDMRDWPVPEGYELRNLDPEKHTDLVLSTWPNSRCHSGLYIWELIHRLPSVGLFRKTDERCVGVELRYEYGALGMLFVEEQFRGRGFGKVISAELAKSFFREGYSAIGWVIESNESSIRMHETCGFKAKGKFDFLVHHVEPQAEYFKKYGYKVTSWK